MHPAGAETTHAITLSSRFFTSTSPVIGLKPSLIYYMNAFRSLSSASYHLPTSLVAVLRLSPDIDWFWNEQGRHLLKYNRAPSGDIRAYDHFIEVSTTHNTRNTRYQWEYSSLQRPPLLSHFASIRTSIVDENHVRLHSITSIPASPTPPINVRAVLHSWGNDSLWRDLQLHGDGTWVVEGLIQGTIEGAADGSFMVEVCPDVCSAAFMLICTVSKRRIMGTGTERSQFAGNLSWRSLWRHGLGPRPSRCCHIPSRCFSSAPGQTVVR
jgi:hypothetical protein